MKHIVEHLSQDPVMAVIIERIGPFAMTYRDPTFEALVRSIVSQQLSTRVARVIFDRLAAKVRDGKMTPENVLRLRTATMRKLGLSGQKIEYIRSLAKHALDGSLPFESLAALDDAAVIARLTQVKGVGVWTAHMFLMFGLRRPNVLAVGDLGIRQAIQKAYGLEAMPKPAEVERIAASWKPHCSAACWYLWRSLEGPAVN